MSDDSIDDFIQFQIDKDHYEYEKTLILQNDEVQRLKDELQLLYSHVKKAKKHSNHVKLIYKQKVKSIKKEIKSVPTSASIVKSKLISDHTKAINELKEQHDNQINALRIMFEESMRKIQEIPIEDESLKQAIKKTEKAGKKQAEIILQAIQKSKEMEAEIEQKINQIQTQIDDSKMKANNLQDEIDKLQDIIAREKQQATKYRLKIQKRMKQLPDYSVEIKKYDNQALIEENHVKDTANIELEQIRTKINGYLAKSKEIQSKIDSNYTENSPKINENLHEMAELEAVYQKYAQKLRYFQDIQDEITFRRRQLKENVQKLKNCAEDLEEAQNQNATLLEEVRRLDFMVYGRMGKYQIKEKSRKRNVWVS